MTNKSGSNDVVRKLGKSTIPIKSKSKRNNSFYKLMLIIYKLEDSWYINKDNKED